MRPYRVRDSHALVISELDAGAYAVKGDLTFATINKASIQALHCTRNGLVIQVDLQAVTNTDSAGLALMLEWLKITKKNSCTLSFINIPPQLQALAKISGINANLTFQTDDKSTPNNTSWIN